MIDELNKNQRYYYNNSKSAGKGKKGYNFDLKFELNDEENSILFDSNINIFIYDINLQSGKRIIDIWRAIIQNKEYYQVIEHFIKALEKNDEEMMIDELYKEIIELYSKKKGFTLMSELFLKISQKKRFMSWIYKNFKKYKEKAKSKIKIWTESFFWKIIIKI